MIHDANRDANRDASRDASRDDGDRHHHHQTDGIRQPVLWRTEPQWPRGCTVISERFRNGLIQRMMIPDDIASHCLPFQFGISCCPR